LTGDLRLHFHMLVLDSDSCVITPFMIVTTAFHFGPHDGLPDDSQEEDSAEM
jgi:hypothetical protein